jgi:hypothetical protein
VRWNMNTDTPLPPDEPAAPNPPDGAILDYYLAASGPVILEVLDSAGKVVRRYSSNDPEPPVDPMLAVPTYWVRPPHPLSNAPGMHRFVWDLHYAPLPEARPNLPMQAIVHDTAPASLAPWAMPGAYTVKLTVNGQSYSQPLTLKMDPRVHTPPAELAQQFALSKQLYDDLLKVSSALDQIRKLQSKTPEIAALEGAAAGRGRGAPASGPDSLTSVSAALSTLLRQIEAADAAPTTQAAAAVADRRKALSALLAQWKTMK